MNKLKSYFMFSSGQRNGIFVLLLFILLLQLLIYNFDNVSNIFIKGNKKSVDSEWIALQSKIDSLKQSSSKQGFVIQPFNPNYISDYKGYNLGMSVQEIDRLHRFRKEGKFVNSVADFKKVTQISDSLLNKISPYFKFPDWVVSQNNRKRENHQFFEKEKIVKKNINLASKEELMKVYGIGDKLSYIILRDKEKFGEFADLNQLQYVWGISPETFEKIKERFFVKPNNGLKKIKINEASTKELSQFPYFNYKIAKEIVTYRSMNGGIKSFDELTKIKEFPVDKIEIIILYLETN